MRAIRVLQRCLSDCRGATAVEYGLIVALVVLAAMAAITRLADANTEQWTYVRENVETHMGP